MKGDSGLAKVNKWAGAALVAGLVVTLLGAWQLKRWNTDLAATAVATEARDTADAVVERIRLYEYGLHGARGAIVTAGEHGISRRQFRLYSTTRDVDREFPGARGFGFIRRVPVGDEVRFVEQARADDMPGFAVRQLNPHAGERFLIQYIEPLEHNRPALGLDIASETNRREAAIAAIRSGQTRLTGPITLVQATGQPQQSFLILLPVYRGGAAPDTVEAREEEAFGWSYAPLLMEEVLAGLNLDGSKAHLVLRDVTDGRSVQFFESGQMASGSEGELFPQILEREVYGRSWQIEYSATPLFIRGLHQASPALVMLFGAIGSVLLGALVGVLSINRQRRSQIAAEQALRASIVDSSADGIIGKSVDGVVTSWNRGAEHLFGYSAEEALGRNLKDLVVPDDLLAEEAAILKRVRNGDWIPHFETRRRSRDGRMLDVSVTVSPIFGADGQVVGASKTVRDISDQKAAEARILELNAGLERQVAERTAELSRLNLLLGTVLRSASEVSIIATDLDGVIRVFNRGAERLLGYTADEMVGRCTPEVIHLKEEVAAWSAELSAALGSPVEGFRALVHNSESEGAETREWTYVRKDGSQVSVTLVVTAMRDEDGQLSGYLGIAIDITERKAVLQKLAASLETTRAILATVVNPVVTIDASGIVQSVNPAGERVFGYSAQAAIGQHVRQLIPDYDKAEDGRHVAGSWFDEDQRAGRGGREATAQCKDGSVFPVQISIGAMDRGGERMFVAIITDISLQKRQRSELLAARDQLLMAAEVAELGIWSWNVATNELQWNDRMFEFYGLPLSLRETGLNYEHWRTRVHPDDIDAVAASLFAAIEGRGVYDETFRVFDGDEQIRYLHAGAQVERDAAGGAVRVTGINRDITAQLALERGLLRAKEEADAASAAKSSFLANMSHEIRTPMNAVLGMLQLVRQTELSPRQHEYLKKAHSAATSLLGLLNDALDYSKIEAGKLQLDLHPFELDELMNGLGVVLSGNRGQKDVELMFDVDPHLPAVLVGDNMRLQQVLINLAGNALKFTEHGQIVVSVSELGRSGDEIRLRISVTDTGIGISAGQLETIFEAFNQAEASTTRRFGGTGLGLGICRRLVSLMGGELKVRSELGKGSSFWFDITLGVAADIPTSLGEGRAGAPLRVLVVDDNPALVDVLMRTASAQGWLAQGASSGRQAVDRVREARLRGEPYDAVLMDWRMPELDGLSAAQLIRDEQGAERPPVVIMITGYEREVLEGAGKASLPPFADLLVKPVTPKQLVSAVRGAVAGAAPATAHEGSLGGEFERLAGLRILIVEDNELNREVAEALLCSEGAVVSLAACGLDGVRKALEEVPPFDVVIMDVQMPDIDGLEATRRIRADGRYPDLPILAMTANVSPADREACLAAGMNDHVGKPIDLEQLVAALCSLVGGKAPPASGSGDDASAVHKEGRVIEPLASILLRFGGNLELVRRLARAFAPEQHRMLSDLSERIGQRDAVRAADVLHTMKGNAGTIGASALAERASALEARLRCADPEPIDRVLNARAVKELTRLMQQCGQQLAALLSDAAPPEPERAECTTPETGADLSPEMWREKLKAILRALESGNLSAIDLVEALPAPSPELQRRRYDVFVDQVQGLDFAAAIVSLRSLLEDL
ncbi:two-component system sensor histidine kinase/response regulator [Parazoarcus communis]|uniref:Sensory/regulatory protein RpfC n=1 Tax=Parazoarcus communis TaxID=41977 RepID=A0A2U8GPD5_9RHOO|nr:PAS domain S-box protein [Parazoarcus communis]AWI74856.1 two-component system sensor histidine kinase/response regulator [Parazoarcus communis]